MNNYYSSESKDIDEIINNIKSFNIKKTEDEDLNDLLNKMLSQNVNKRISWEDYFNHPFFSKNLKKKIFANFICLKHNRKINFYCQECKSNI